MRTKSASLSSRGSPGSLIHRLSVIGLLVATATFVPPQRNVGACRPGAIETAPATLEADVGGPEAPEVKRAVLVRPASRVGCSCGEPCIDAEHMEFVLRTPAQRIYVTGGSRGFIVNRAAHSSDDEARFYIERRLFGGTVPSLYTVSAIGEDGRISPPIRVTYDPDSDAEFR